MDCRIPRSVVKAVKPLLDRKSSGREPAEYISNDLTETVHLKSLDPGAYRTLCGQQIDHFHTFGDETLSGFLATCKKCLTIFRGEPVNRKSA